ncbi:MAG: TraR/DksA family transcriptional regulator [Candidatus Omnitrophota bacterium]
MKKIIKKKKFNKKIRRGIISRASKKSHYQTTSRSRPGKKFNKKSLLAFKKLILKRKEQILQDLGIMSEDTFKKSQKDAAGDISGYTYHMADVATDNYDREFSLSLASNERRLLYELDDSLKKIQEGTFGVCEDCKSLITRTRLNAIPYARHCLKCQERREKR